MNDIERIASMKVNKENTQSNYELFELVDWFAPDEYSQKIQRDVKKMCYNLLKYFDPSDFPNGTFAFKNCCGEHLYNRGMFAYQNNEFNILLNPEATKATAYIYEKGGVSPIWSVDNLSVKETVKALYEQLKKIN